MAIHELDGHRWAGMVGAGAANLHAHMEEVNDLNVFPIPDGDTGENMMLTMQGGLTALHTEDADLSEMSEKIAGGMLLGARGNSGVILSQFFEGIAKGFQADVDADVRRLEQAIASGVDCAFESVVTPTEGTILTVMKDACGYAASCRCETIDAYFEAFLSEAKRSLERTPDLLPVLKEAGVVDSGGAGLIYIVEGMYAFLCGKAPTEFAAVPAPAVHTVNPDLFTENDVMQFGYCTELLLRLQTVKTEPERFDVDLLTSYLQGIGNSVVTVKNGTIVKLHVHTMTPYKVLEFCQQYGEFLTVKIENMMLQHNETLAAAASDAIPTMTSDSAVRRPYAVIAVASGDGISETFCNMGADRVIRGGQTMNPSAEDFLHAVDAVNADTVFILPNNGNVLLAARQAAQMCERSDVRVIPTHSIGDGYAVLSMLDFDSGDADQIEAQMNEAMNGVLTAEISQSIRDAEMNGIKVQKGDYIGIIGKEIVAAGTDRIAVVAETANRLDLATHEILLLIRGRDVPSEEAERTALTLRQAYPFAEVCESNGGQEIYDYILVAE